MRLPWVWRLFSGRTNRPPVRGGTSRRFLPGVEPLEGRVVLATLHVTTLADNVSGSLRFAISTAASGDTIDFPGLTGTINLGNVGDLLISKNLTIQGPGADRLTVAGPGGSAFAADGRVFDITNSASVSLFGLTIRGGRVNGDTAFGGGLRNAGTLTIDACRITGNQVSADHEAAGGGIYNTGTLTLRTSLVDANQVFAGNAGGDPGLGGGIRNLGTASIFNTTIYGNLATGDLSGIGREDDRAAGGAIDSAGTLTLINCTVAANQADGSLQSSGGGLIVGGGTATLGNTIFDGNSVHVRGIIDITVPNDVTGNVISLGGNIISITNTSSGFGSNDKQNVSASLGPLQLNGGPTATAVPGAGSQAIDAGLTLSGSGNIDQRGAVRTVGTIDAGAVETQAPTVFVSTTTLAPGNVTVSAGQSVSFTATVTPVLPAANSATPAGSVVFKLDGTDQPAVNLDGTGKATLTLSSGVSVGSHTLTATYTSTNNYSTSTSNSASITATQPTAVVTLTAAPSPATATQTVTLTATVAAPSGISGQPTGSVTFLDGTTPLGSAVPLNAGVATITTSTLSVATHTLTARYSGDATFQTADGTTSLVVQKAQTTTALTVSPTTASLGQAVTLTATVAAQPPITGVPTGTVNFLDGNTVVGSATLNAQGVGTLVLTTLGFGSHTLKASYVGDANFATSDSSGITVQITKIASTTTLVTPFTPTVFGQRITMTANVTSPVAGFIPTGTVEFYDTGIRVGTGTLTDSGQAFFTTAPLTLGPHSLTARYLGDTNFLTSSSPGTTLNVGKADSRFTLLSSANHSVVGQPVTYTVTVLAAAPGNGAPTGNVSFRDDTTVLVTKAVDGNSQATFSTTYTAVGSHPITVQYFGDDNFNGATSAVLTQVVDKAATTTTLTASADPVVFGQTLTLTAGVAAAPPGAGTPTGTVTFFIDSVAAGTVSLSNLQLAMFSVPAQTAGTHSFQAQYNGDANFLTSFSATLPGHVSQAATTTALAASGSIAGEPVQLTATVRAAAPGAGIPTGMVFFTEGGVDLGSAKLDATGQATFATAALPAGLHSFTARYAGDANFLPSSTAAAAQVTLVVVVPPRELHSTLARATFPAARGRRRAPQLEVFDGSTGLLRYQVSVAGKAFRKGLRFSTLGDVNNDGTFDVVVVPGRPDVPQQARVFDGRTGATLFSFFPFGPVKQRVRLAVADLNGDGFWDIVTRVRANNRLQQRAFNGRDLSRIDNLINGQVVFI